MMVCTSLSRRWNSEIAGYARRGRGRDAVQLYMHILRAFAASFKPNHFILASVVRACASLGASQGRQIHAHVIKNQFQSDAYIASALLHVYGSNDCVEDACQVFDRIPNPNVVCYTAMMVVSVRCGIPAQAWSMFKQMQARGVAPNSRSFSAVLGCCEFLEQSQQIHGMAAKLGLQCSSVSVGNSLVNAYAKLGRMNDAYRVFDLMAKHDVVSWNCMISGCCQSGNHDSDALHWYRLMLSCGSTPDDTSLASVISSCSKPDSITYGSCSGYSVGAWEYSGSGKCSDRHVF